MIKQNFTHISLLTFIKFKKRNCIYLLLQQRVKLIHGQSSILLCLHWAPNSEVTYGVLLVQRRILTYTENTCKLLLELFLDRSYLARSKSWLLWWRCIRLIFGKCGLKCRMLIVSCLKPCQDRVLWLPEEISIETYHKLWFPHNQCKNIAYLHVTYFY
jgi:hypothetical protein